MQHLFVSFIMMILPLKITSSNVEVEESKSNLEEIGVVTVTTYKPTSEETDSTPNITASGFKISNRNPKRHRIIAVSRDLKRKLRFGQRVRLRGAGKYNGEYVVRDVMNSRYKKRIDILINPKDKQTKISKVKMYKVK